MAVYYCHGCERYIDDDWHPMEIKDDKEYCPDCYELMEDEDERCE